MGAHVEVPLPKHGSETSGKGGREQFVSCRGQLIERRIGAHHPTAEGTVVEPAGDRGRHAVERQSARTARRHEARTNSRWPTGSRPKRTMPLLDCSGACGFASTNAPDSGVLRRHGLPRRRRTVGSAATALEPQQRPELEGAAQRARSARPSARRQTSSTRPTIVPVFDSPTTRRGSSPARRTTDADVAVPGHEMHEPHATRVVAPLVDRVRVAAGRHTDREPVIGGAVKPVSAVTTLSSMSSMRRRPTSMPSSVTPSRVIADDLWVVVGGEGVRSSISAGERRAGARRACRVGAACDVDAAPEPSECRRRRVVRTVGLLDAIGISMTDAFVRRSGARTCGREIANPFATAAL